MEDFIISCLISLVCTCTPTSNTHTLHYAIQTMFSKYLLKTLWNLSQGFMEFVLLVGIHCHFDNGHMCELSSLCVSYMRTCIRTN